MNGSPHMKNRKVTATMSSDSSSNAAAMNAAGGKREKKGKIGKFTHYIYCEGHYNQLLTEFTHLFQFLYAPLRESWNL